MPIGGGGSNSTQLLPAMGQHASGGERGHGWTPSPRLAVHAGPAMQNFNPRLAVHVSASRAIVLPLTKAGRCERIGNSDWAPQGTAGGGGGTKLGRTAEYIQRRRTAGAATQSQLPWPETHRRHSAASTSEAPQYYALDGAAGRSGPHALLVLPHKLHLRIRLGRGRRRVVPVAQTCGRAPVSG